MSSNVINGPSCLASKAHQERKHGFTQLTRSTANSARLYSVILLPPRFKMAPVHESWDLTVPVQGLNNFPMDSLPTQYLFCWKAVGEGKHASHEHLMHQQICLDAHQRRSNKELFFSFFFPRPSMIFRMSLLLAAFVPITFSCIVGTYIGKSFASVVMLTSLTSWSFSDYLHTHTLSLSTNKLERLQNTLNWSFVIKLIYLALGSMCPFLSSCLYPRSTVCTVSPAHKVSVFRFFRSTRPRPRMIRGLAREMEHSATCRLWNCNWKTGNCSNVTKEIINHPYFDGLYIHVYTTHKNGFYGTFGDGLRLLY